MASVSIKKKFVDPRYSAIKTLIEARHITSFRDIFLFIPKTVVYKDLGANFIRFDKAIFNPGFFRLEEILRLAEMFGIDDKVMIDLAYDQIPAKEKRGKKQNL